MKRKKQTESALVAAVIKLLRMHGCYVWRQHQGLMRVDGRMIRFGSIGLPDVIGVTKNGRMIAVECKTARGVVTGNQRKTMRELAKREALVYIIRSDRHGRCEMDSIVNDLRHGA